MTLLALKMSSRSPLTLPPVMVSIFLFNFCQCQSLFTEWGNWGTPGKTRLGDHRLLILRYMILQDAYLGLNGGHGRYSFNTVQLLYLSHPTAERNSGHNHCIVKTAEEEPSR